MAKTNKLITTALIALVAMGIGWYIGNEQTEPIPEVIEEISIETSTPVETPEINDELPTLDGLILNVPGTEELVTILEQDSALGESKIFIGQFTEGNSGGDVTVIDNQFTKVLENNYVVPFVVNNGGTGTFMYLGLLSQDLTGIVSHVDSIFLGDRVGFGSLLINDDKIQIEIIDRHGDQAMAEEPAVVVISIFEIQDNKLKLLEKFTNIDPDEISIEVSQTPVDTFPITLTGSVPANWVFEGDFPVTLTQEDSVILEHYAVRNGAFNESAFEVEFTSILKLEDELDNTENLVITLFRDNVSDDQSLDASYSFAIKSQ